MPHMATLGSAYEEITKQGIDKEFAIPKNLNLKVVSGFIETHEGMLPPQIDCMLVHGEGKRYGLTDQFIYLIDNVLCIFEVKKTLRRKDFVDAFEHLGLIRQKFADRFEHKLKNEGFIPDVEAASRHFAQITGRAGPRDYFDIHSLEKPDAILFYSLVQESLAPVSIIQGYGGYKTEEGLRTAFIQLLEEKFQGGGVGLGVPSIPSVVTSNQFSLVKGNGMPFLVLKASNEWVAVFSTRHSSIKVILELIWTKISAFFDIKMPWNDQLHMDSVEPLLIATAKEADGRVGWLYKSIHPKESHLKRDDNNTWQPSRIGRAEISAFNIMAMQGGYLPLDEDMNEYLLKKHGKSLDLVTDELVKTRFFMVDGQYLRPISNSTHMVVDDEENGFVCCERDRFDLWCKDNGINGGYVTILFVG